MTESKCLECNQSGGEHYNKCQYDNPPGLMTLEWLLEQEPDFHICKASRGMACPVCEKNARYCGHTKEQMVAHMGGVIPVSADVVNHPNHYTSHPSGVECITVTEHMGFNVGNAVKYLWRAGLKGHTIQDLQKARWYIDREITRLGNK
jgi:hypothetical protein